jgi:hypothetical protein
LITHTWQARVLELDSDILVVFMPAFPSFDHLLIGVYLLLLFIILLILRDALGLRIVGRGAEVDSLA